jgi:hypothetical protein
MPTNNYYVATHHALLISVVALAVCTTHFYQFPVYMCVWITILHFSARKRSLYMDFGSGNCLINNPQASNYETLKRLLFNFRGLTEGFKCFRKPQSSPKLVYLFLIESQTCKVYQLCPKSFKKFLTWLYC